jgi:hypothetical protein
LVESGALGSDFSRRVIMYVQGVILFSKLMFNFGDLFFRRFVDWEVINGVSFGGDVRRIERDNLIKTYE